jgi:hypothetical protein
MLATVLVVDIVWSPREEWVKWYNITLVLTIKRCETTPWAPLEYRVFLGILASGNVWG